MALPEFLQQWQALPQLPELYLYAIVDSAQDARLLDRLHKITPRAQSQCLLADAQGPELSKAAPHLVILPPVAEDAEAWLLLFRSAASNPASLTIIASPQEFAPLHAHLVQFTEIVLPDGDEMYFAFWDPAVLGTLVGQKDDHTLHVPGPVLSARQCSKLLTKINVWWYWDRSGNLHQIREDVPQPDTDQVQLPLKPTQVQLDMLIEASVPDNILAYIKENKSELLFDVPENEQYRRIKGHLLEARKLNLTGMKDMLNYIGVALTHRDQLQQDSAIKILLTQVKMGQISLTDALEQFP